MKFLLSIKFIISDADFILFVNLIERNPKIHAGAVVCLFDKNIKRPLGANLVFNSYHGDPSKNSFSESTPTIMHEVFHGLFFSRSLFKRFKTLKNGKKGIYRDSKGTYQVRSDTVLKVAREHFNCNFFLFKHFFCILNKNIFHL